VYFTANTATSGLELWRSNGTSTGTTLVKDINPGTGSSYPYNLTTTQGTRVFGSVVSALVFTPKRSMSPLE